MVLYTKEQVLESIGIYSAVFLLGIMVAIPGPTLLDLSEQVGVSSGDFTTVYTSRAAGYLAGCLIGGALFDKFSHRLVLCLTIAGGSVFLFGIPWCSSLIQLIIVMCFMGFFGGALDSEVNSRILIVWGKAAAPFMQALHFLFGMGALMAPLIVEPFLSTDATMNSSNADNDTLPFVPSRIVIPYSISSGLLLLNAAHYLLLLICLKENFESEEENNFKFLFQSKLKCGIYLAVVVILVLMICGTELTYGQLLTAFSVDGIFKLSKSTGSFLTAMYWGAYSFGRFLSIFVAMKLRPLIMLAINFVLLIIGSLVLILSLHIVSDELLWPGTALVGFGIASGFPSLMMWTEEFLSISGKVASVVITGTALGEMIVPLLTGQLMERGYVDALIYVLSGTTALNCLVFAIVYVMARAWTVPDSKRYEETNSSEEKEGHCLEPALDVCDAAVSA